MFQTRWPESSGDVLTASRQIGTQAFVAGSLKPQYTDPDAMHANINRYQGAFSVDQDVVLMVHPISNPAGVYFPLKVAAGEASLPMQFDEIRETGTTGTLTDVHVFPY